MHEEVSEPRRSVDAWRWCSVFSAPVLCFATVHDTRSRKDQSPQPRIPYLAQHTVIGQ